MPSLPPSIEPLSRAGEASSPGLRLGGPGARGSQEARATIPLVEELLAEQRTLTVVSRFARAHDDALPAQARYYRDLIPLAKPAPGEQYAFTVDLDKCSGCKACVSACHSMNGLDEGELWRSVGLIVGEPSCSEPKPVYQHITTACHHCVEPGCAEGCPVLAYEKDPLTGIVRHLDDQCIGCQYCIMKCPYDVPRYSSSKGIVRKCDMCYSRLTAGEAPACVQACPHGAIAIDLARPATLKEQFRGTGTAQPGNPFLPGSPAPEITLPTTRYRSATPWPSSTRSADEGAPRLEPGHWPLVLMLVLTQFAGGIHLLLGCLFAGGWTQPTEALAASGWGALIGGLVLSIGHLGRPLKAWRVFLGWRRSWMSREIIMFGAYGFAATGLAWRPANDVLAWLTIVISLVAIGCSAMVYADTGRPAWRAPVVFTRFFGTMLLLGAAGGAFWATEFAPQLSARLAMAATVIRTALFLWEWLSLRAAKADSASALHRTAQTASLLLGRVLTARFWLFGVATASSVLAIFDSAHLGWLWAGTAFGATFAAQALERYLFFAASAPVRMPGIPA